MAELTSLMDALNYQFGNPGLLEQALTHRSYVNEQGAPSSMHNERLEFLGDAVVDLSIADQLMRALPGAREGRLSKLRSNIVSEPAMARIGRELNVGAFLRLGRGEEQSGGREKASILSDAFEAVVGAVYLDGGFVGADEVVRELFRSLIEDAIRGDLDLDHKTRLQELAQAAHKQVPRYTLVKASGPDHAKVFRIAVFVGDDKIAEAEGTSKKQAEQQAAEKAIAALSER